MGRVLSAVAPAAMVAVAVAWREDEGERVRRNFKGQHSTQRPVGVGTAHCRLTIVTTRVLIRDDVSCYDNCSCCVQLVVIVVRPRTRSFTLRPRLMFAGATCRSFRDWLARESCERCSDPKSCQLVQHQGTL